MPWEKERNIRSLSPHGLKEAEGHATRGVHDTNSVGCPDMPPGLLGAPIGTGSKSSPYMPTDSRPARNDMPPGLLRANGALDPNPHPYTPAAQKQAANTYGKVRR